MLAGKPNSFLTIEYLVDVYRKERNIKLAEVKTLINQSTAAEINCDLLPK